MRVDTLQKNESVIDYMIAPPELFEEVKDFQISDFNPLFSDVHCAISFGILSKTKPIPLLKNHEIMSKIKWENAKNSVFVENIDNVLLEKLENLLDNFSPAGDQTNANIELFVKQTNDILIKAKEKTFEPKIIKTFHGTKKSWYDQTLTRAKNKFHSARKQKNRANIRKTSKKYKSLLKSKFKIFTKKRSKALRENKVKNPKYYWDLINGK